MIFVFIIFNMMTLISVIAAGLIYQNFHIKSFTDMISDTMNHDLGYSLAIIIMSGLFYLFYQYIVKREHLTWADLGFTREQRFLSIIQGFGLGVIFVAAYLSVLIVMGQVEFTFRPLTGDVMGSLLYGIVIFSGVAFAEEITFRGYFQNFLGKQSKLAGLILTAILFALNHLLNAGIYTIASLVYLTIGGVLFGVIRMGMNNIWFPIGFHIAWNWTEIRVFGLENSSAHHWMSTEIKENTIWNGGGSGSGLIIIFAELVLIIAFGFLYKRSQIPRSKL